MGLFTKATNPQVIPGWTLPEPDENGLLPEIATGRVGGASSCATPIATSPPARVATTTSGERGEP